VTWNSVCNTEHHCCAMQNVGARDRTFEQAVNRDPVCCKKGENMLTCERQPDNRENPCIFTLVAPVSLHTVQILYAVPTQLVKAS